LKVDLFDGFQESPRLFMTKEVRITVRLTAITNIRGHYLFISELILYIHMGNSIQIRKELSESLLGHDSCMLFSFFHALEALLKNMETLPVCT